MAVTTAQIQTVKDWGIRVGIGDDLMDCLERMKEEYEIESDPDMTLAESRAFVAVMNGFGMMFHGENVYD
jgi:hypothetical protein